MKAQMLAQLLALIVAPVMSFASPKAQQTVMTMQPWWPVQCAKHDYPLVNQVSQIERVAESKTQVTFTFRTVVGACDNGLFEAKDLNPAAVTMTEQDKLVLFKKLAPVISETQLIASDIAQIRVTFDKTAIFKKKDHAKFLLQFFPNGYQAGYFTTDAWERSYYMPSRSIRFMWKVEVARVSADESIMRVLLK